MRYAFQGLVLNEFQTNSGLPNSQNYINELGFNGFNTTQCAGYLFMFVIIYGLVFLVALKYINFEER